MKTYHGKLAGRITKKERKLLMRPEHWNTYLRDLVEHLGFVDDRFVCGLAAFEPTTVGLSGNCGDIIRWKDPMDPERHLRQYMFLISQIKPGLFVSLHVQSLPPIDGHMYV